MTGRDDESADREAILARRAIFLSTALAALHCGAPDERAEVEASTTTTSEASASTSNGKPGVVPPRSAPWDEVVEQAPPRGIPASVSEAERRQLQWLEQRLDAEYGAIREVWEASPDCDAAAPDCRPRWREVGDKAKKMFDATRGPLAGRCMTPPGETGTVEARRRAHQAYLQKLLERVEAHLGAVAAAFSPQGEQEWLKILSNAKKPPPMPCLSPCAQPDISGILDNVLFGKDDATPPAADTAKAGTLSRVVSQYKANTKPAKLVVRGHADPGEQKPAELAAARAKAVADWLAKEGVPKNRIETRSLGTDLPVGRADTEDGRANNRRVDFEVVPL
jgi:outer membrane protein OmpA-like peptidoglycan-associated protein